MLVKRVPVLYVFFSCFICFLSSFTTGSVCASELFTGVPLEVFTGEESYFWARVERHKDPHPGFVQENFHPEGERNDPILKKWFGNDSTPHSGEFLLHCAEGYDKRNLQIPVLLIHGASDNANRAWIHPYIRHKCFQGEISEIPEKERGFAYWLSNLGYPVFAVTFAHGQGDNFMQSEQIADAITRIRQIMKRENDADFKVSLIAHSKGNIAARLYLSGSRSLFPRKKFLTEYRGDVKTYIAVAPAMRGIDTPFRYYVYNLALAAEKVAKPVMLNAPIACDRILVYGLWKKTNKNSIFPESGDNLFPGQCQLLYNLAEENIVPLGLDSNTSDFNQTMIALYYGGTTAFLSSRGIEKAIDAGERLMYKLESKGINPDVSLCVLAGNCPNITYEEDKLTPMPWEKFTPAGDGLIPLESSTFTDNILNMGANLIEKKILYFNHLDLARHNSLLQIIDEWLL
ncbi:MAG: hypothetical protein HQM10_09310 [Candidatus Riflebacteria bacterium]|nr:hypothetical protein [Candidatus Riflebacteria bacterium]